jgi:hypothetical protein
MTRNEIVELSRAAYLAADRYVRNERKLQFMSLTKNNRFAFEQYGDQLAAMKAASDDAGKKFAAAVVGMSTEEIVSIITESRA